MPRVGLGVDRLEQVARPRVVVRLVRQLRLIPGPRQVAVLRRPHDRARGHLGLERRRNGLRPLAHLVRLQPSWGVVSEPWIACFAPQ
jgi:hypothetical protein